jgi:hypothetical protein
MSLLHVINYFYNEHDRDHISHGDYAYVMPLKLFFLHPHNLEEDPSRSRSFY